MKILRLFIVAVMALCSQLIYGSAPDTVIVKESTHADWAAGTIDSLNASADTLRLDIVRTFHFGFTNCGQTGRLGPNQAKINSAYIGTDLNGVVTAVDSGVQQWITPQAGIYRIMTAGAGTNADTFLRGAIIQADFELPKSDTLNVLVAQMGASTRGGSGGSFVVYPDTVPLIIAGGAAGIRGYADAGNRGSTSSSGVSVSGPGCSAVGGEGGMGGQATGGGSCSGAGAGLLGDGQGCGGGFAYIHGGGGGIASGYIGGFGGGGGVASASSPGGGGGYSGGSVHYTGGTTSCAGGGGSYIDSTGMRVITSDGNYNGITTFYGDTIGSFNDWHIGQGVVNIDASQYRLSGTRISPAYNVSTAAAAFISSVIEWNADLFNGTSLMVETSFSLNNGNSWSAWSQVANNGDPIPGLIPGSRMDSAWVKTRMTLATTALFASPQVYLLKITVINDPDVLATGHYPDEKQFSIYPNPSNGTLNIVTGKNIQQGEIKVINMMGEKIVAAEIIPSSTKTISLNAAKGVYFMHVNSGGMSFVKKLVIE